MPKGAWTGGGVISSGQVPHFPRPALPNGRPHPGRGVGEGLRCRSAGSYRIRKLAALVWPADHPESVLAADSGSRRGQAAGYADWEVLQAEVLMPLPPSSEQPQLTGVASMSAAASAASSLSEGAQQPFSSSSYASCCWGEGLWCFNPACTNLSGPSELAMQTSACGGGCGVRYCSTECQAQGWRDGHRLSCARLRARREGIASTQMCEGACLGEADG